MNGWDVIDGETMRKFIFEYLAPRAILFLLAYSLAWSVVDFTQGGL